MPRQRSTELMLRDVSIRDDVARGRPRQEIADAHGISLVRVCQINSEQYEGISEDEQRNLLIAQLEYLNTKLHETIRNPPQKVTPSGRLVYQPLVDSDGEIIRNAKGAPLDDFSSPVLDDRAVSEASKAINANLAEIAKLQGVHRKAPKPKDEVSPELEQAMEWVKSQGSANRDLQALVAELQAQVRRYEAGEIQPADIVPDQG